MAFTNIMLILKLTSAQFFPPFGKVVIFLLKLGGEVVTIEISGPLSCYMAYLFDHSNYIKASPYQLLLFSLRSKGGNICSNVQTERSEVHMP